MDSLPRTGVPVCLGGNRTATRGGPSGVWMLGCGSVLFLLAFMREDSEGGEVMNYEKARRIAQVIKELEDNKEVLGIYIRSFDGKKVQVDGLTEELLPFTIEQREGSCFPCEAVAEIDGVQFFELLSEKEYRKIKGEGR